MRKKKLVIFRILASILIVTIGLKSLSSCSKIENTRYEGLEDEYVEKIYEEFKEAYPELTFDEFLVDSTFKDGDVSYKSSTINLSRNKIYDYDSISFHYYNDYEYNTFYDKLIVTTDNSGNKLSSVYSKYIREEWVFVRKVEYKYNGNDCELTYYNWNDGEWVFERTEKAE